MRKEILEVFQSYATALKEYAAVGNNQPPQIQPSSGEMIYSGRCVDYKRPNAHRHICTAETFAFWLAEGKNVPVLFNHEAEIQVGVTTGFKSDEQGLNVSLRLDDTPAGQDVDLLIKAGVLQFFSVEYWFKNRCTFVDDNTLDVYINHIYNIAEVSLVLFPAGQCTSLDIAQYRFKEGLWTHYMLRLINYYKVARQIQTEAIRQIAEDQIDKVKQLFALSDDIIIRS